MENIENREKCNKIINKFFDFLYDVTEINQVSLKFGDTINQLITEIKILSKIINKPTQISTFEPKKYLICDKFIINQTKTAQKVKTDVPQLTNLTKRTLQLNKILHIISSQIKSSLKEDIENPLIVTSLSRLQSSISKILISNFLKNPFYSSDYVLKTLFDQLGMDSDNTDPFFLLSIQSKYIERRIEKPLLNDIINNE